MLKETLGIVKVRAEAMITLLWGRQYLYLPPRRRKCIVFFRMKQNKRARTGTSLNVQSFKTRAKCLLAYTFLLVSWDRSSLWTAREEIIGRGIGWAKGASGGWGSAIVFQWGVRWGKREPKRGNLFVGTRKQMKGKKAEVLRNDFGQRLERPIGGKGETVTLYKKSI